MTNGNSNISPNKNKQPIDQSIARLKHKINKLQIKFGQKHPLVAECCNDLAMLLVEQGYYSEAEHLFHRAIEIREKFLGSDHHELANSLAGLAILLKELGRYSEAEPLLRRSNIIIKKMYGEDHPASINGHNSLAVILSDLGRYSEAEPLYRRVLELSENSDGPEHYCLVSLSLHNLGCLLMHIGCYSEAEQLFRRSLALRETKLNPDHPDVANCLISLANLLRVLGRNAEAERLYRRALDIRETTCRTDHPDVAISLINLAALLTDLSRYSEAGPLNRRAFDIFKKNYGSDHLKVAMASNNLADFLIETGSYSEAEPYLQRALLVITGTGEPIYLATVLNTYSDLLSKCGHVSAGIILGKRAIKIVQLARKEVSNIGQDTLKLFDKRIEVYYTNLAEMLIKSDRIIEAEHVLGLLKEDEYFEFVRRDGLHFGTTSPGIAYNPEETLVNSKMDVIANSLSSLCIRRNELQKKKSKRTSEENSELINLCELIDKASQEFEDFLDSLHEHFGSDIAEHVTNAADMESTLWEMDKDAAVIYTLSTKDSFYTILATCHNRQKFTFPISSEDFSKKVLRFRELIMKRDKYDIEPLARELYDIIISQKMAEELKNAGITTLLWMLEGSLRLLPVSALHDGANYIVDQFRNVYITTKSRDNFQAQPKPHWTALGMGVTQAHEHFKALPAVKEELEGIVNHHGVSDGVIPGEILLDSDFTWNAMTDELDGNYQAVHIASHFNLDPCNETMSYLLLGDGSHLSMDKLKKERSLFRGVDLLAFSACSTGVGTASKRGREIDGIGYIGETQGAKTVMATLWPVADESTSLLMTDFYRRREAGASKIEALRQAQLGMLNGTTKPTKPETERSGEEPLRYEIDKEKPYAHPYYWAPYILIGNYR